MSDKSEKKLIRVKAKLMLESYTKLGKRETEWEKEYYKGIRELVDDIIKLTE